MQGLCMLRSQTYILEYYSVLTLQWKFCFKNICVVVTASASSRFIFRSARLWMIGWHVFKCPFSCVGYVRMKHNSCESKNLQPIFNTVIVTCPNSLEPSSVNIFLFTAGGKCVYIGFRFFFFFFGPFFSEGILFTGFDVTQEQTCWHANRKNTTH